MSSNSFALTDSVPHARLGKPGLLVRMLPMSDPKWGPNCPHPLSKMRTELVWEGKYDEYGNRREVDVAGLAMPLQRIETIDEPRSRAAAGGPG